MANDVDLAQALATAINDATFSQAISSEFRFDQYLENEDVDSITVRVSVESDSRTREGRGVWHRQSLLSVVMIAPQQVNSSATVDAVSQIENLLDLWDEVLDYIQTYSPNGRSASSIESFDGSRYDKDKLQNDRQFRSGCLVEYRLT